MTCARFSAVEAAAQAFSTLKTGALPKPQPSSAACPRMPCCPSSAPWVALAKMIALTREGSRSASRSASSEAAAASSARLVPGKRPNGVIPTPTMKVSRMAVLPRSGLDIVIFNCNMMWANRLIIKPEALGTRQAEKIVPSLAASPKPHRILVVNDDGIDAEGIKLLEEMACRWTANVWGVAPAYEK